MQHLHIGNNNDYNVHRYENFEISTPKLLGLQTTFVKLSKFSKACFLKTLSWWRRQHTAQAVIKSMGA